jgi:hypothetical protein
MGLKSSISRGAGFYIGYLLVNLLLYISMLTLFLFIIRYEVQLFYIYMYFSTGQWPAFCGSFSKCVFGG